MESSSSSDSMDDDSFRARVHKIFGSLSSSSRSSWSVADDEIEKREWKRDNKTRADDDDEIPCSSSFDGLFAKDRKKSGGPRREKIDDDEDENDRLGGGDDDRDEWEIRSSIGLDRTLDNEEEEDEYDKVAEGRENAGDRLYMRDVTDHGPYLNSHNVLPSSIHDAPRDLRANHFAARIRLIEDEADAQKFGPNHTEDKSMSNVEEPHIKASVDGIKLKSILKRKSDTTTSGAQKRVRFDPGCKDNSEEASEKCKDFLTGTPSVETTVSDDNSLLPRNTPAVPDYLLNPSKYTHYSFDSTSEVDDESNSQACMDFLKLEKTLNAKDSSSQSGEVSSQLPKSITFIPRKKESVVEPMDSSSEVTQNYEDDPKQPVIQAGFPVGIAAEEIQRSEASVMEDEPETNAEDMSTGFQKPCRRYRTKSNLDDPVS